MGAARASRFAPVSHAAGSRRYSTRMGDQRHTHRGGPYDGAPVNACGDRIAEPKLAVITAAPRGGEFTEHIDASEVSSLIRQLGGDRTIAQRFVADYVALWPVRLRRLQQALQQGDMDEAVVVLLSIVSSSRMVGAVPLSQTARQIQQGAHDRDRDLCAVLLPRLRELGAAACCELSNRFDLP